MVDLESIQTAASTLGPYLHRTPMLRSEALSDSIGAPLAFKAEHLQKTGSFKPRGALNAVLALSPEERARGVIAVSAGNHAQGVAFAARVVGISATLVMPETATRSKVAAVEGYGARAVLVDGNRLLESMEEIQLREGQVFIHPFDNPNVISGQGTVGLEIFEDEPDVQLVVVPIGGGGLISGVSTALKSLNPRIEVVGVEPQGSAVVSHSLAAGKPLSLDDRNTIADGLNAPWSAQLSLDIIRDRVDRVMTVSDAEIARAMKLIIERTKQLVEPSGAAGFAALLSGKVNVGGRRTATILSGGNVDVDRISELLGGETVLPESPAAPARA
ncbi:MAG: threonine ammonia-lyase [Chloroflexota bacterium]